jgi:hypothetical protein
MLEPANTVDHSSSPNLTGHDSHSIDYLWEEAHPGGRLGRSTPIDEGNDPLHRSCNTEGRLRESDLTSKSKRNHPAEVTEL